MTRFLIRLRLLVTVLAALCALPGLARGDAAPRLRVGVYNNYPLLFEKAGQPTGFQLELLKAVAKKEGWRLDYQFLTSLKNALDGLEADDLDLAVGVAATPDNLARFDLTSEKTAVLTGQVFVASERDDIQAMADLEGKSVAYITQGELGPELVKTSELLRVRPLLKELNTYEQLEQAVAGGAVDAGLFNNFQGQRLASLYNLKPTTIVLAPTEVHFAVRKGSHPGIVNALNQGLRALKTTDSATYQALEAKFLRPAGPLAKGWQGRQLLIALGICLLLVIVAVLLGNFIHDASVTPKNSITQGHTKHVAIFVLVMSLSFWLLDSVVAWTMQGSDQQMSILEWTLTKVPGENLYVRAMIALVCFMCGIFGAKYMNKYDELIHILVMSLSRFEQLTDNARDMIFRMSLPKGEYEFVSKAASQILGYPPEEFYKKPLLLRDLVHKDWRWYFSKQWEELLAGTAAPFYEYQVVDKAGTVRWLNQRTTLYFDEQGTPCAVEGIITDVTELRQGRPVDSTTTPRPPQDVGSPETDH